MTQTQIPDLDAERNRPSTGFVKREWPYLLILTLALAGVALSSLSQRLMIVYWEAAVPIFAVACFFARGGHTDHASRIRSIRQDALHWLAVFLAMRLIMLPDISQVLNANALALMLLTILALGLFTSGNLLGSWRIASVGVLLAAAVPAIAWMERSTLLLALVAVGVLAVLVPAWLRRSTQSTGASSGSA